MSTTFKGIIGNFYKFYETTYDCEVVYKIQRLYHFLFNYKNRKKRFSIPHEFDRITINLAEKTTRDFFMHLFKLK